MTEILQIGHTWDGQPVPAAERATVRLRAEGSGVRVAVEAPFFGDAPPPASPGPCDRLWQFEVVEVFLAGAADARGRVPYTEVELSPHGHYLVLRLLGVRNPIDMALPLSYRAVIQGQRWHGEGLIPRDFLPAGRLSGNAYSVHGPGASRRYLAAEPVPGERPDFHRLDRFRALELAPA